MTNKNNNNKNDIDLASEKLTLKQNFSEAGLFLKKDLNTEKTFNEDFEQFEEIKNESLFNNEIIQLSLNKEKNNDKNNLNNSPENIQEKITDYYKQSQLNPVSAKRQIAFNFSSNNFYYKQFEEIKKTIDENEEKYNRFKNRIKIFEDIATIDEAKIMLQKFLPVKKDFTIFNIGDAKCTVINRDDLVRITFDCNKELICYDFVP